MSEPSAPLPSHKLQARGKLHKVALQFALEGSVTDLLKAALAATGAALAGLSAPAGSGAGAGGALREPRRADAASSQRPELVLVLGHSLVVHLPCQYIAAAHASDTSAAAAAVAGAVQQALSRMCVGRAKLAAAPAAVFTAGRTLHPIDQVPVAPAAVQSESQPAHVQQRVGA